MKDLKELRQEIDEIDDQLLPLFIKRMEIVKEVADYKAANAIEVKDNSREEKIIARGLAKLDPKWHEYYREFQNDVMGISRKYQHNLNKTPDDFIKNTLNGEPLNEVVFALSVQAEQERKTYGDYVINATLGSLHDEEGPLSTLNTVYKSFQNIDIKDKANYASAISGNPDYCEAVFNWLNRKNNIHLPHAVVATTGGSGAVSAVVSCTLNPQETLLIPEIAWGSYAGMATQNNLKVDRYPLFTGNEFAYDAFAEKCTKIIERQHKLVVVLNDPCQNPTGLSLGKENWQKLIALFNSLTKYGKVVVLNDLAYFDYAYDQEHVTDYMETFNDINEDVAIVICFSCSKSFTAYGMRAGAAVALTKTQDKADELYNVFTKYARATWSNINNGFMDCFVDVMKNHKEEYLAEKAKYIALLKQRSDLFVSQAKKCGLPFYPYTEGFFITLRVEDADLLDRFNKALIADHIFALKTTKGIRIAVCGLSVKAIDGLAYRMKKIYDTCL